MIPRAVQQVFTVTEELKSKGWEYTMEGQFLEIVSIRDICVITGVDLTDGIVQRDNQRPSGSG